MPPANIAPSPFDCFRRRVEERWKKQPKWVGCDCFDRAFQHPRLQEESVPRCQSQDSSDWCISSLSLPCFLKATLTSEFTAPAGPFSDFFFFFIPPHEAAGDSCLLFSSLFCVICEKTLSDRILSQRLGSAAERYLLICSSFTSSSRLTVVSFF